MSAFGKFKKGTVTVRPKPDTPTDEMTETSPSFSMPARPAVAEIGELGAPAIPVSSRSDIYSIKDPKKLTPAQEAELVERRNEAVRKLLSTNAAPSESELRDAINAAEVEFYREHLKSRFGGRKTTRRKSKVRIPIKKNGDLTNLGYSMTKKARTRHGALKKAVKKFGRATVSRKLNALAVLNKRRHPATARKARADRKYAMTQ